MVGYAVLLFHILNNIMKKDLKDWVKYLWVVFMLCTLTACMNGGCDLAGKWQLRQYQFADGTAQKVDSVFYNFQKGSFSVTGILKDGGYTMFFGNYSLIGDEISINLLPESVNDKNYDVWIGWPEGKRTFKVEELSFSALRLEYEGTKYIFRKY